MVFPYVELRAGCHFARDDVVRLQKGLRLRFLESHSLEKICLKEKNSGLGEPEFGGGDGGGVGCVLAI